MAFALWTAWGFAGSGAGVAWRQGWRGSTLLVASVLGSLSILFTSALLLQLTTGTLGRSAWLWASIVLSVLAFLVPGRPAQPEVSAPSERPQLWIVLMLIVASAFALSVIAYRAIAQPLTGPDTIFRWDFLARQILRQGNMDFYPQKCDTDYTHYMWADGIPPLVSLVYAWGYMGGGNAAAVLTAPVVLLVAGLGFLLVGKLSTRIAGGTAGLWAVALLAGSALNTWSVSMGQETGVTTLAVLALCWALGTDPGIPDWRLAALAASVAALARDYGPTVAVAGLVFLAWKRRPLRELLGFVAVIGVLVAPWYFRNWVRTGNPVFNVDLHGLFPVNRVHADMMNSYAARYGFSGHWPERLAQLVPLLWPVGGVLLVTSLVATRIRGAWTSAAVCLALIWILLWAISVGYTAGGVSYSLRILSPVLALASAAGGVALSRVPGAARGLLAGVLVLISAEASARALVMMHAPSSEPFAIWGKIGNYFSAYNGTPAHDLAAEIIGSQKVLVDDAYAHAHLVDRGVVAIPLWSPGMAYLRDPGINVAEAVSRLRSQGINYVWITAAAEPRDFFGRFPFFIGLGPWLVPIVHDENWELFSLREKLSPGGSR